MVIAGKSGCSGQPAPQPVRGGGALGERGEDRRAAGDVAVDDVLVAVLGRGPLEPVERHEAARHVQQVGDLLDAPPLVGGGVLGVVGHRPEVVLVDVPGVAVEVLQRRLVAGRAAADQRVPVQVAPVQLVGPSDRPTGRLRGAAPPAQRRASRRRVGAERAATRPDPVARRPGCDRDGASTTCPAPCTPCQITAPWWSARYGHSRPPNPSVQCSARSSRPSDWVASNDPARRRPPATPPPAWRRCRRT